MYIFLYLSCLRYLGGLGWTDVGGVTILDRVLLASVFPHPLLPKQSCTRTGITVLLVALAKRAYSILVFSWISSAIVRSEVPLAGGV